MKPKNRTRKIIVLILLILVALINIYFKNYKEKIQIIQYNYLAKKDMKTNENIANSFDNEKIMILYNTIFVPMNETLRALNGEKYQYNKSQAFQYEGKEYYIDIDSQKIEYENKNEESNIDNSVEIEIEKINNEYYIPLYFVSNLPKILVKVNKKNVYCAKNYINAIDAIQNGKNNEIKIYKIENDGNNVRENYYGEKDGALWREEALKRIEKYRKKTTTFLVKNNNGETLNAQIDIKMHKNDFWFGTAIRYNEATKENIFDNITKDKFNLLGAENAFKWSSNLYYDKNAQGIIEYAKKNKMSVKGHYLFCDYANDELKKYIGDANNPLENTMAYIYNKHNSGEIGNDTAKEEINGLKKRFEDDVLNRVIKQTQKYPYITEWEVVNEPILQQYFKYYLFDENFLNDKTFLDNTYKKSSEYIDNNDFYSFIANCIDCANENSNARLTINENRIGYNGDKNEINSLIKYLNGVQKYTNNLDGYGVQYHVEKQYNFAPQHYYNQINYVSNATNIHKVAITEYDNLGSNYQNSTDEQNRVRGNYLRDALIAMYSNQNVYEFTFWVYNSGIKNYFSDYEKEEYSKLIKEWLNYESNGNQTNDGKIITRLYKGVYEVTATLKNGKKASTEIKISDDNENITEIIIDATINNAVLKSKPSRLTYNKGDELDLTDGIIELSYDDGTKKEITLTDSNCEITGFDKDKLGKQTINVRYQNYNFTYDVYIKENESKSNEILNAINNIEKENRTIYDSSKIITQNQKLQECYSDIINNLEKIKSKLNESNIALINEAYQSEFKMIEKIMNSSDEGTTTEVKENLINAFIETTNSYSELYKYYITNDTLSKESVKNKLNDNINKYNDNSDIDVDMSIEVELINISKKIYNEELENDKKYLNYLKKIEIVNICNVVENSLEIIIRNQAEKEYSQISYSKMSNELVNSDETVTINLPNNKTKILNNDGQNTLVFNENGSKIIKINIRGYDYDFEVKVNNIDKVLPTLNIQNENTNVKFTASDDNFEKVVITKDGKDTEYNNEGIISTPGIYTIMAEDKAGNSTTEKAVVYAFFTNEKGEKVKYVPISLKTKIEEITENTKYSIERKSKTKTNNIATGDELKTTSESYLIIVKGDVNEKGEADIISLVQMRKCIVGTKIFTDVQKIAADLNENGKIDIVDLIKERKNIVGDE